MENFCDALFTVELRNDTGQIFSTNLELNTALDNAYRNGCTQFEVCSVQAIDSMLIYELCLYMELLVETECPFVLGNTADKCLSAVFHLNKGEAENIFKRHAFSTDEERVLFKVKTTWNETVKIFQV